MNNKQQGQNNRDVTTNSIGRTTEIQQQRGRTTEKQQQTGRTTGIQQQTVQVEQQ